MRYTILIICFFTLYASAYSQFADSIELEEVEIKRYLLNDSIVDLQTCKCTQNYITSVSLPDYLGFFTTAFIRNNGVSGSSTISLKGMNPQHTQVVWNGIPVNNSSTGITDLSIYPSLQDQQLTFPNSNFSISNRGNSERTLRIYSTIPKKTGFQIGLVNGSFGKWKGNVSAIKSFDDAGFKLKLDAGYTKANNDYSYQDYNTNPVVSKKQSNADYQNYFIQPALDWKINDLNRIKWVGLYTAVERELAPAVITPNNKGDQNEHLIRMSGQWKYNGDQLSNQLIAGYTFDDTEYIERSGENLNLQAQYKTHKISLENSFVKDLSRYHFIRTGGDITLDLAEGTDISQLNQLNGGLSVAWDGKFLRNKLLTKGLVRGNFNSHSDLNVTGGLSVIYQPSSQVPIVFELSTSRNVRYPTINDRYFEPSGNEDLLSEKSWEVDGGIVSNYSLNNVSVSHRISGYATYLKDMILWVPTNKLFWEPINLSRVKARGLSLINSIEYKSENKHLVFYIDQIYQLSISTNEENLETSEVLFPNNLTIGKQLPYIPEHQLKLNYMVEYRGIFMMLNTRYTSPRYITGSNSYFLQKYWLIDGSLGYNWEAKKHAIKFKFTLKNLSDNEYYQEIAHIPMPGRNYEILLVYGFKKDGK